MSDFPEKMYSVELILRLACAAQRVNNGYLKGPEAIYTDDSKLVGFKYSNRDLVMAMLDPDKVTTLGEHKPELLNVTRADADLVEKMRAYYKRLIFAAVEGTNEFQVTVNGLLNSEEVALSGTLGYLVCLPSVYERDKSKTYSTKALKDCEAGVIGTVDEWLNDKDSEIVDVKKSKNFDAYNVLAIIDNKIVSWMCNKPPVVGPAVVIRAKIKGYNENWLTKLPETRLNYVKVAQ
jgi:hypothetical protein